MTASLLQARVHTLRHEAERIMSIELRPVTGNAFPAFEAGAHIDLHLPNGLTRSYSLANDCQEKNRYLLGVLNDRNSRGGSRWLHEHLRVGACISISPPRNNFPLDETCDHSVLIAGGIGITPILSMARRLSALNKSYEVIYCARTRSAAAFIDDLQALGSQCSFHIDDEQDSPPDLTALLSQYEPRDSTHLYACGPSVMLDAFEACCRKLGHYHAHIERFSAKEVAPSSDAKLSYTVELRRSGRTFEVPPQSTLHRCLIEQGIPVPFSCEEGICGSCETQVLHGDIDHRDSVLTVDEKAKNTTMMVCVSGCKSDRLVLDL